MADIVASVLQAAAEKEANFKTTEVVKYIEPELDEGNLLSTDSNPLDFKLLRYFILKHILFDYRPLVVYEAVQIIAKHPPNEICASFY